MKKRYKNNLVEMFAIILAALACSVFAQSPNLANSDRAEFINNQRNTLAGEQHTFIKSLPNGNNTLPVNAYLERLRQELRIDVKNAIVGMEGGELDLAVKRAAVRNRLERIRAYEAAYGLHEGTPTTKWNVLSSNELLSIEKHLKTIFRELNISATRYPSSQTPSPLLGKLSEVRAELDAVTAEKISRPNGVKPKLTVISTEVTAKNKSEALSRIEQLESSKSQVFAERNLYIEIEERLNWNPDDVALKQVKQNIKPHGAFKELLALLHNKSKPSNWPPSRPRGPPGGISGGEAGNSPNNGPNPKPPNPSTGSRAGSSPPKPPSSPLTPNSGAILVELQDAISTKMDALVERNYLQSADAKARLSVSTTQIQHITGTTQSPFELGAASMSDANLHKYHADLNEWKNGLIKERDSRPISSWHGEQELRETELHLEILREEIRVRGPPPDKSAKGLHSPHEIQKAIINSPPSVSSTTYEKTKQLALEHQRLLELHIEFNQAPDANKPAIKNAIAKQEVRHLQAEADAINNAWKEAIDAERRALIDGRGVSGSQAAHLAAQSKNELRKQADALRALIDSQREKNPKAINKLRAINIDPPSGTGVGAEAFRPHSVFDVTFRLQGVNYLTPPPSVEISGIIEPNSTAPKSLLFDERFTHGEFNSSTAYRKNPKFAPGGVVIDLRLPSDLENTISSIKYDALKTSFYLQIDSDWLAVEPKVLPSVARAALGFVVDGRVAAVDIGSFDSDVQMWLAEKGVLNFTRKLTSNEKFDLLRAQKLLKTVRINPSLVDTKIALPLIAADELIFSVLSLDTVLRASERFFRGIDTLDLHKLLRTERDRLGEKWFEADGYKSLLTVDRVKTTIRKKIIHVKVDFNYDVYALPNRLDNLSGWFSIHDTELRESSPELQELSMFSVAVAIIKTAIEGNILENYMDIATIIDSSPKTPRLLCRSQFQNECESPLLKKLTTQLYEESKL